MFGAHSRSFSLALVLGAFASVPALAQQQAAAPAACGGDLSAFLDGVRAEALTKGLSVEAIDKTLAGATIDQKVLSRDRAQGVFRQTFTEFSQRTVSQSRLNTGKQKMQQLKAVFDRAESEFGVPPGVIAAFWAMETDFGAVQGDFNTRNALVTLSHDCRRPQLFRPQLISLIEMVGHGDFEPATETGAWAGEIGQVQMLPEDIIAQGVDGDGDGHVRLKESAPDAIMTAAKFINSLGYKRGEPWIQEVRIPQDLPFEKSGLGGPLTAGDWFALGVKPVDGNTAFAALPAALVLPQGRFGPTFITYPNFGVYLEWNQSFVYTTSAAYFATRLMGATPYDKGNPEQGLDDVGMKALQTKLQGLGHDVGKVDGILGSGTRIAVQKEQKRLGLPADGWPTQALLDTL